MCYTYAKSNSYQRQQQENFDSCDIPLATVAPFLSEIDNLPKEERVVFLASSAFEAKKNTVFLKWTLMRASGNDDYWFLARENDKLVG